MAPLANFCALLVGKMFFGFLHAGPGTAEGETIPDTFFAGACAAGCKQRRIQRILNLLGPQKMADVWLASGAAGTPCTVDFAVTWGPYRRHDH